jgi:dTDP-4-dehydrorhamnose 3,5-epimerase
MMGSEAHLNPAGPLIGSFEELQLALPRCSRGIGTIITAPGSADLIAGVRVQSATLYPDDRGYFLEVQRIGKGLTGAFPAQSTQVSVALSFPETIKAFHYHLRQTDCWSPVKGMLQVALVDLRLGSPTFGGRNTRYVGALRAWQILIPPGVAHGYKVVGSEAALLVYLTDRYYDPKDEGRIPTTTI